MESSQLNSTLALPILNIEYYTIDKKENNQIKQTKILKKKVKKYRQFTKEEDQLLLLQIVRNGKRFEAIAKTFPKRSKHELKNRYYTYLKYRENELFDENSYYSLSKIGGKSNTKQKCVSQSELLQEVNKMEMDLSARQLVEGLITKLDVFFSSLKQSLHQ